ncbi:MAG TPA: assimilatory sulfite reductase (NADPH) flavoprotein subunit [Gammaproteobacteria bacterium]|nr:assimilatory sulfite reductase (NADPH) flavoprotein subunit [Gammaproteobacteria bacterium]
MSAGKRELGARPAGARPHDDAWRAAPFSRRDAEEVRALVARLAPEQRLWLSGYLLGSAAQPVAAAAAPAGDAVTVLFGSQSGNSERLASRLAERLAAAHTPHRLLDMLDCRKADLEQARVLLVIVSTHGDGEPPERAVPLHELLHGRKPPRLDDVRYAVLALGDSSYEQFCATGRVFDARLAELGAQPLQPRTECDVDFETEAASWIEAVVAKVAADAHTAAPAMTAERHSAAVTHAYTRKNPFAAELLVNQRLTARGSSKDVRHLELSLDASSMHYEPGDSLGVVPRNSAAEVDALLAALRFDPEAPVPTEPGELPLRTALVERYEIGVLGAQLVRRYAGATGDAELERLAADADAFKRFARGRDLRDLVAQRPPRGLDPAGFVRLLQPLAPRLYSIASSAKVTPDEAHLTVGVVGYESLGRARRGVVSGALAEVAEGDSVPVYLQRNTGFRLPSDPSAAIVMIGAGTGIAPFRAFVAEREALDAAGRHWLVFGDRSFELDFLYQADWLAWRKRGVLARLDVAFSRDQASKIYVQHRLREHGAELWAWLQDGAHLYVCGDAEHMAPDVEQALLDVARRHGGLKDDAASEYLLELQRARRYQRDVY